MIMRFSTSENLHLWWSSLFLLLLGSSSLNPDGTLLLSFKYSVLSDPLSVLDNWNYADDSPCSWTGIYCAQIGTSFDSPELFRVIGLVLPNQQILGSIPEELGFIQHLRIIDLSNNFLNGTLPDSLFNASELHVLSLSKNMIFGELPELAGGPTNLQLLNLSDNALTGKIPESLTSLQNLTVISLRSNYFSGGVPSGFVFVEVLDLSSNLFNGSLPVDFGGERLRYLNVSYNKVSGSIPLDFARKIPSNASIDVSFNNLTGEIPETMALINQKTESFDGNENLCGMPLKKQCAVPSTMSFPPNVTSITSTPAIAAIPETIDSTPATNSSTKTPNGTQKQQQSRMTPGTIAGIAVGDLTGVGILAMIFLYAYQLKKTKKKNKVEERSKATNPHKDKGNETEEENPSVSKETKGHAPATWPCLTAANGGETSETTGSDSDENAAGNEGCGKEEEEEEKRREERSLVMVDGETEMEMETLMKASAYVLGSSGWSIMYKAVVDDGTAFAVRRIGEGGGERRRDFEKQVRAVAKMRHPNLVRIRGFYCGEDEKLVIYDYVSNGSLASTTSYSVSKCAHPTPMRN
ncbi:hypothetical protein U1Q18_035097 [Sarracenia purpurea var. burkii]